MESLLIYNYLLRNASDRDAYFQNANTLKAQRDENTRQYFNLLSRDFQNDEFGSIENKNIDPFNQLFTNAYMPDTWLGPDNEVWTKPDQSIIKPAQPTRLGKSYQLLRDAIDKQGGFDQEANDQLMTRLKAFEQVRAQVKLGVEEQKKLIEEEKKRQDDLKKPQERLPEVGPMQNVFPTMTAPVLPPGAVVAPVLAPPPPALPAIQAPPNPIALPPPPPPPMIGPQPVFDQNVVRRAKADLKTPNSGTLRQVDNRTNRYFQEVYDMERELALRRDEEERLRKEAEENAAQELIRSEPTFGYQRLSNDGQSINMIDENISPVINVDKLRNFNQLRNKLRSQLLDYVPYGDETFFNPEAVGVNPDDKGQEYSGVSNINQFEPANETQEFSGIANQELFEQQQQEEEEAARAKQAEEAITNEPQEQAVGANLSYDYQGLPDDDPKKADWLKSIENAKTMTFEEGGIDNFFENKYYFAKSSSSKGSSGYLFIDPADNSLHVIKSVYQDKTLADKNGKIYNLSEIMIIRPVDPDKIEKTKDLIVIDGKSLMNLPQPRSDFKTALNKAFSSQKADVTRFREAYSKKPNNVKPLTADPAEDEASSSTPIKKAAKTMKDLYDAGMANLSKRFTPAKSPGKRVLKTTRATSKKQT